MQDLYGPAFFLPARVNTLACSPSTRIRHVLTRDLQFATVKTYDYHPPMRLPDPESPDRSLGDCAICMDAIIVDSPAGEKGTSASKESAWAGVAEGHPSGIFNVVHRNVVGAANMRKSYSLAPCHHLFVSFRHTLLDSECRILTPDFLCTSILPASKQYVFIAISDFPRADLGLDCEQWLAIKVRTMSLRRQKLWLIPLPKNICPQCRRPLPPL